jgi:hypothetical protein
MVNSSSALTTIHCYPAVEPLKHMLAETSSVGIFAVIIGVPIVTRLMLHYAATTKAKRIKGTVVFPATSLAALCAVSLGFAVSIIVGGWNQDARLTTSVIGLVWAVFSLLLWPTTIVINSSGIAAKHIWRPTRKMAFEEVDFVSRTSNREAVIYGNGKTKEIAVSQYHVAPDELEAELRKHGMKYYAPAAP